MTQTAVDWLENEFQEMCKDFGGVHSDFLVKFDQAKAMEKEQIELAHIDGGKNKRTSVQYYNEIFKTE